MSTVYGSQSAGAATLLRKKVRKMHPGVPLPPVAELVHELGVSRATVVRAYDALEAEGLLERRPRKGVFVAQRTQRGDMAIVARGSMLGEDCVTPYYRKTAALLTQRLHEQNAQWNVRVHAGRSAIHERDFAATLDLLRPDVLPRLSGVFSFVSLFEMEQRLLDAGVPVVGLMKYGLRYRAFFSDDFFIRESTAYMAQRGYRRVGVVGRYGGVDAISQRAPDYGVQVRPEWCVRFNYEHSEPTAYEGFRRIWHSGDRPEALIVNEDVCTRGVLRAAAELGVRFPEDMALFTFAVRGVELPYPRPLSRIEYDPEAVVDCAMEKMQELLAGRELAEPITWIPGQIIAGETA